MENNSSYTLLDDRASDGYDELKGSLDKISKLWEKKKRASFNFTGGVIEGDTRAQWRKELAEFLESTPIHVFIVALLLVDLCATAVDIIKTIHIKSTDLDTCVAYLERCDCVDFFERTKPWEVVFWISIAILTMLALNVVLLLVAFGVQFFRNPGYVLDAFVVGTAMLLEIFLNTDTVGLLVILNLWRIVRVAHGIFEVTDESWEKEINSLKKRLADEESERKDEQKLLREKDQRIAELERVVGEQY